MTTAQGDSQVFLRLNVSLNTKRRMADYDEEYLNEPDFFEEDARHTYEDDEFDVDHD